MPLSSQTQQLFDRVYGRSAESNEERSFLKDLEARKGSGTAATLGGIQHAQQSGRFGGGQGASGGEIDASEKLVGGLENAYKLMQKKAKQLDEQQKKLFTQDLKLQLKQELSTKLGGLQDKKGELSKLFQTEDFGPKDSELLDPRFVDNLARQERGNFAQQLSNITEDIRSRDTGIGDFLDRLEATREQELKTAQQGFANSKDLFGAAQDLSADRRAETLLPYQIESQKASAASARASAAKSAFDLQQAQAAAAGGDQGLDAWVKEFSPSDVLAYSKAHNVSSTPEAVLEHMKKGGAPKTAAEFEKMDALSQSYGYLQEMRESSNLVNTGNTRYDQITSKLGPLLQGNNEALQGLDSLQITATSIARSLGEKGVISDGDIARIRKAIPDWNDTAVGAKAKLDKLEKIINIAAKRTPGSIDNEFYSGGGEDDLLQQALDDGLIEY